MSEITSTLLEFEVVELLDSMLEDASREDRELARLLALDHPRDEISRILGLSYENTNTRIHRLRRRLRDHPNWLRLKELLGIL